MTPKTSAQLYSIRNALDSDLDGSLARLAGIGFERVEAFDFVRRASELGSSLRNNGLAVPTGHAVLIEEKAETPDGLLTVRPVSETFEAASALGMSVVIDPWVPPARWSTRSDVERIADKLNERAQQAAAYGLRVGYHNHDHELRTSIEGLTAFEMFAGLLEPAVALEVDLYWVTASGHDPVAVLERLGDRVVAVHVKDGPMREGITASDLPTDQLPAGQGDVPLSKVLKAFPTIEYGVIEFDHFDGDIFDGIAQSLAFLRDVERDGN